MIGNHFGPVDRTVSVLIDRAYPVVKAVYLKLDDIKTAVENLDVFTSVNENLPLYQYAEEVSKVILPVSENLDEILQADDNAALASSAAVEARKYYELSKQWAIQEETPVAGEGYSSKYWALKAGEVSEVIDTAINDMETIIERIDKVEPVLNIVEENIEDIQDVSNNLGPINIVSGDLSGNITSLPQSVDMGRVGTGDVNSVEITGGNIKTVADNIEDIQVLGDLAEEGKFEIAINAVEASSQNVLKAKDWAVKLDGPVEEDNYSSKYYAQQAQETAENAASSASDFETTISQAKQDIAAQITAGVQSVTDEGTEQVNLVNAAGTNWKEQIDSAVPVQTEAVQEEGTKQIGLVQQEGTTQVSSVQEAGTAQVSAVASAGQTQIGLVEDEGETQVQLVITEGTTQKGLVTTEGKAQVSAVTSAGSTQVDAVIAEGTKQVGLVTSAGTEKLSAINTAGESHLSAVNNAGSTQVNAVNAAGAAQVELVNSAVGTSLESINTSVQKAKDWAEKMDGEVESGAYSAKYWAQQASTGQIQADWNEADSGSKSFIQNKPDLSVYALKSDISSIYKPKGSVDTYGQLPSDPAIGDVYNIATEDKSHGIKAGDNVVWQGEYWDNLSGFVDLAPYLTSEAASGIYLRQDTASTAYATKSELSGYALSTSLNQYLPLAGGTVTGTTNFTAGASFTGNVTVPTPTVGAQAANKSYVDTAVSSIDLSGYLTKSDAQSTYLKLTGGNITGNLNVSNLSVSEAATFTVSPKVPEPGLLTDAANKQYVDTAVSNLSSTVSQQYVSNTKLTEQMALKADKEHTHTTANITNFTDQVNSLINNSKIIDYGRVGS